MLQVKFNTRILFFLLSFFIISCASRHIGENKPDRIADSALPPAKTGTFADLAKKNLPADSSRSIVLPIDRNDEGLRWRLMLFDLAASSIDIQTYSWKDDEAAILLFDRVLAAADRGVKVRILVDDLQIFKDEDIAIIDSHPNIQVRLFNPWHGRETTIGKGIEFLFDMDRLNQRMHNKLIIVDNLVSIVGGRNFSNDYYGLSSLFNFRDMDAITLGPVSKDISNAFDIYWNHEWSYPGSVFTDEEIKEEQLDEIRKKTKTYLQESSKLLSQFPLQPAKWTSHIELLATGSLADSIFVVYDDPPKTVAESKRVRQVQKIKDLHVNIEKEIIFASAYFIPDSADIREFKELTEKGVRVRVLTNSLGSNDATLTNSVYKKWRRPLVEAGVELHELHHDADDRELSENPEVKPEWLALHTKYIVVDRKVSFAGSMNMDPRSLKINTEVGMVIYDSVYGGKLAHFAERDMSPRNAWRVGIDEEGELYWESKDGRVFSQPVRTWWNRVEDTFNSILPIDDQL
jgi:putative cardiolipin synthase